MNDAVIPGGASRIVVNGASGGGAQSKQLGATSNSQDYLPCLKIAPAAGIDSHGKSDLKDDVFAIVAHCQIQNLGRGDLAYEWMFKVLDSPASVAADQKSGLEKDANGALLIRAFNPDPACSSELMQKFVA